MSKKTKIKKYTSIYFAAKFKQPFSRIANKERENRVLFIESFPNSSEQIRRHISRSRFDTVVLSTDESASKKLKEINKAHFIFLDNFEQIIGFLDLEDKEVILYWHADGAIKKFGLAQNKYKDVDNYETMIHQNTYNNITKIAVGSDAMQECFKEAMRVDEKKFLKVGNPGVDYAYKPLFKDQCDRILMQNNNLIEKKSLLYAPTFRDSKEMQDKQKEFLQELVHRFSDQYEILACLHPATKRLDDVDGVNYIDRVQLRNYLQIVDLLITDYSSIAMERAIFRKPIYFYLYDCTEYYKNPGLFILPSQLPGPSYDNAEELFENLDKIFYDEFVMKRFDEKWNQYNSSSSSRNLVAKVLLKKEIKGVE